MFFKSTDPDKLYAWYECYLGICKNDEPGVSFKVSEQKSNDYIVWSLFKSDADYFSSSKKIMINFVVDDIEVALQQVVEGGATKAGDVETYDFGKFGWFIDPDGNKVELWELINKSL